MQSFIYREKKKFPETTPFETKLKPEYLSHI